MSARLEYAPGEAWCVAAGAAVVVCERDLPPVRARALYDAAATVADAAALRRLLELEPTALIGLVDTADARVLLRRHGVPATADDDALPDRFGPEWALDETPRDAVVDAGGLATLAGQTLPLEGGVARVAAVRIAPGRADAVREPVVPAPVVESDGDDARFGDFGQTLPPRAVAAERAEPRPASAPAAEPAAEPAAPVEPSAPAPVEPSAPAPVEPSAPAPVEPSAPAPVEASAPAPAPAREAEGSIGGLIDSVPGFIKPAVDVSEIAPAPRAAAPAREAAESSPAPGGAEGAPTRPVPLAQPAASVPVDAGDHDGMTITAEQARRLQAERAAAAQAATPAEPAGPPATGPLVLSSLCGSGHVNAPGTTACTTCGAPVDDRSTAQRRRPEVAVAVLPSGERVPLGRGVVLGRRPRSRRVEDGRVPRLVTVESPSEDISRSHLELRVDDWNLVAVDLSSTNGTLLLREGSAPQRLRPEAATILQLGDRLDLGDGVVVAIEPARAEDAQ
ncbi:FHA domain-containing protein [Agrococcus sp. Marseille-Q4369]|uniref:FHA domain-containing protein n=1 Tax=Agrococcus sp. Marseille-Q4369 TaxID=2810513 RepID=UPI001B8AF25F|nr:FHA domain-containing protein [Agrococcus sp. Marseille-Q4369]QUW17691.1 FHA domain-containing protein [Agrococcus sp. Marseille-Q4369]